MTPLLKVGKDPKDVWGYRPVALTNILCKIFEGMTNKNSLVPGKGEENK